MKTFFKSFLTTILVIIILALIGFAGYFYFLNDNEEDKIDDGKENLQFLMLGVDSLDSRKADNARSDTIMVVNVDCKSGKVNIISIPRDTYSSIKGYKKTKINHSFKYGGSELTLDTVNNLLGTDIKYYVTVDYRFVEDVVDKIGGVTVDVPLDMNYEDPTADPPLKIDIKEGTQTLKGNDAIGFLRYRKGYPDADLGRVKAQQQFMSSLLSKMKEPKTLLKAPLLMSSYVNYSENNIPAKKLAKIAIKMRGITSEDIVTNTLPGIPKYMGGVSYFVPDDNKIQVMLLENNFK
ncbi:MAG: LCP family protein [Peptoniphilus harei]|uniref:LCP family protein n=1 Tax=Peptoniphilus TaxID=162289 RepID=UPI00028A1E08|nr:MULTISPECIES: LCP family protein [Peptoniphilus]MBS6610951.1 LCP family protein [Peptoniphilus harei]MDU1954812.1 LCP family protein [Peptoniphilus lacydonensis]MDU5275023.1 LCP family protein [Peptoniphilus lacydonensis]MDU5594776.1 LCP family protein [Peptoniphilus rhinitidis]